MDFSPIKSERATAIVSTLVAVAILAGGVTAYQAKTAPLDDVVQLESDLRFQLELAFRHDPNERAARLVELVKVSQAWEQSSKSAAAHKQLVDWMLEATVRSMPGTIEPLPPIPDFSEPIATKQKRTQATATESDVLIAPPPPRQAIAPDALVPTPAQPLESPLGFMQPSRVEKPQPTSGVHQPEEVPRPATTTQAVAETTAIAPFAKSKPMSLLAEAPVRVNLAELAARIAGYHEGLKEVETRLHLLQDDDLSALAGQVRQLADLTQDYHFVKLYYDSLTERERRAISPPRSMAATLAALRRRLDRSEAARSQDYLGEFEVQRQDPIATLRQQLAGIAERAEW